MYFFKSFNQTSSGWTGELWIPGLTPARVTITALGTRLETAIAPMNSDDATLVVKPHAIEMGDEAVTEESVKAQIEYHLQYWLYDYSERLAKAVGVYTEGERWLYPAGHVNQTSKPAKVVEFW